MNKRLLIIGGGLLAAAVIVIIATLALVPTQTNPAYAVSEAFVNAVGRGDETAAAPLMGESLAAWAAESCPAGAITACVSALIPADWGAFRQFVFRRAQPFRDGWAVDLIGYYEAGVGSSGVCAYAYAAPDAAGTWRVVEMAGWVHCADPASRDMHENPAAPNRMPA